MELEIRRISEKEVDHFFSILQEAAEWLKKCDKEMWDVEEITKEAILQNHAIEDLFIGLIDGEPATTIILQEEDHLYWPNEMARDAFYVHKLAVRRKFAKQGIAEQMLNWAKVQAGKNEKIFLRLDCASDRPKLCDFYEKQGFVKVRQEVVGTYPTAFYEITISTLKMA